MNMNFDRFINMVIAEHTNPNSKYHILSIEEEYPRHLCNKDCFMSLPGNNINEVSEYVLNHLDEVYTNLNIELPIYDKQEPFVEFVDKEYQACGINFGDYGFVCLIIGSNSPFYNRIDTALEYFEVKIAGESWSEGGGE